MFCRNCGTEMSDTARFCPKCGTERMGVQTNEKNIAEDNSVKFSLKPEFNMLYQTLTTIWRGLLLLLLIGYCITGFALFMYFPIMPIIFLVIYVVVKLIFGKMQYDNLEYNFYATKVEYIDGFLNKEQKELKYKYIREVTMSQSIFERICHIGTIKVFTNASSGYASGSHNSMKGRNGLYIHCVKNVEEQYKLIKQIIDEGTSDE